VALTASLCEAKQWASVCSHSHLWYSYPFHE